MFIEKGKLFLSKGFVGFVDHVWLGMKCFFGFSTAPWPACILVSAWNCFEDIVGIAVKGYVSTSCILALGNIALVIGDIRCHLRNNSFVQLVFRIFFSMDVLHSYRPSMSANVDHLFSKSSLFSKKKFNYLLRS